MVLELRATFESLSCKNAGQPPVLPALWRLEINMCFMFSASTHASLFVPAPCTTPETASYETHEPRPTSRSFAG